MSRLPLAAIGLLTSIAALTPAVAGSTATHHVIAKYTAPTSVKDVTYGDANVQSQKYGSASARALKNDHFVTVVVRDMTGLPVPFRLNADSGAGANNGRDGMALGEFCNGRSGKLRIEPGDTLVIYIETAACKGVPETALSGTVDFALSSK